MTSLFDSFYASENLLQVFFVTCLLGGGAAWATGRALADSWRPFGQAVVYLLLLAAAVRFAHFALFQGKLFSLSSYLSDAAFLLAVGGLSWRLTRVRRMVAQYRWLYERAGLLGWRERPTPQADGKNPS
jgi:protein-S-isoprenylcysteine O-methyltransferase Ste14